MLTGNNGSAVLLRSSVLVASGTLSFTHNKAMNGAAMKILDMSRVSNFVLIFVIIPSVHIFCLLPSVNLTLILSSCFSMVLP